MTLAAQNPTIQWRCSPNTLASSLRPQRLRLLKRERDRGVRTLAAVRDVNRRRRSEAGAGLRVGALLPVTSNARIRPEAIVLA